MVLIDTSVWVDHFRRGNARLVALLEAQEVLIHPFVIGELACGNLRNGAETLMLLQRLPAAQEVSQAEAMRFVENRQLYGRGLGWIDVHLLAASVLSGAQFWTLDRRLAAASVSF